MFNTPTLDTVPAHSFHRTSETHLNSDDSLPCHPSGAFYRGGTKEPRAEYLGTLHVTSAIAECFAGARQAPLTHGIHTTA